MVSTETIFDIEELEFETADVCIVLERDPRDPKHINININSKPFVNPLTTQEVVELANELVNAADFLVKGLRTGIERSGWNKAIFDVSQGLATSGHSARNMLFGGYLKHEAILKRSNENQHEIPLIRIVTNDVYLPWEFLYQADPVNTKLQPVPESLKSFWGLAYMLTRQPLRRVSIKEKEQTVLRPFDHWTKRPILIGFVTRHKLPYAQLELEALRKLIEDEGLPVEIEVFECDETDDLNFIAKCNSFLNRTDLHILHFACHASPIPAPEGNDRVSPVLRRTEQHDLHLQAYLEICNFRKYLIKHLTFSPVVRIGAPLIFLNACSTGIRGSQETFNFVNELRKRGAVHIIALEAAIGDEVAETFSVEFYKSFLKGNPLGQSFKQAQKQLIDNGNSRRDIMSLFYSLYADESLTLQKL